VSNEAGTAPILLRVPLHYRSFSGLADPSKPAPPPRRREIASVRNAGKKRGSTVHMSYNPRPGIYELIDFTTEPIRGLRPVCVVRAAARATGTR